MNNFSAFLIGGASSGSGKTTLTLGLLRALYNRGLKVAPFKCGPDYIDPIIHQKAARKPSYNLDAFFIPEEDKLIRHFDDCCSGQDVAMVEGVMGLFDGYDRSRGSSAEMAKRLNLPVILVIDAKAVAYSIAAPLWGFRNFDSKLNIMGVIFNRVGSEHHYRLLSDAAESIGVKPLGYIPKDTQLEISSRHLGLTIDSTFDWETLLEYIAATIERHVHIDEILALSKRKMVNSSTKTISSPKHKQIVAIARDEAFNFTYQANIDSLAARAVIRYFSPLHDTQLPQCDLLYLPGGYPEFFAEELASNEPMKQSITQYAKAGGHIWAECGGMMYLTEALITEDGISHPMVGLLPTQATMVEKKMRLGYRMMNMEGHVLRGHEFHYSKLVNPPEKQTVIISDPQGNPKETDLWHIGHIYAGYTHIYWGKDLSPLELIF